jgi:hypothetical protein
MTTQVPARRDIVGGHIDRPYNKTARLLPHCANSGKVHLRHIDGQATA